MTGRLLVLLLGLGLLECAVAADWPQFMGAEQDGVCTETGLLKEWPKEGPPVLWSVEVGVGYGGVAVVGEEVFLFDRMGDVKDALRCLKLEDGKEQWRYDYDAPGKLSHPGSRSTPTVTDRHVYTIGPFGHVNCIDRTTRKPAWTMNIIEKYGAELPRWGVAQSMVLHGDLAIVTPLSTAAGVVALDKNTGEERWRSAAVTNLAYVTPRVVKLAGLDQVVTISGNRLKPKDGSEPKRGGRKGGGKSDDWMKMIENRVIGVAAADGRLLWSYGEWKCANAIPMPFAVGSDQVLITGGYSAGTVLLRIVREGDGFKPSVVFKSKYGSQMAYPVIHDGHIYMICNDNGARDGMVCMDLKGNVKWKTGNDPQLDRGHLLPVEGRIWTFDGGKGLLRLFEPNPVGYKEIAQKKMFSGQELWAPLVISQGRLFVRGPEEMSCLDVRQK